MTTTQNWRGINFSFDNVADEQSSNNKAIGTLECGLYKSAIKNAYISVIGEKNTPALTVVFDLETGKEIVNNFWLTKLDDIESANVKNLRNFLSRVLYCELTLSEFKFLDAEEVNKKCLSVMNAIGKENENAAKLVGKTVLLDITQKPFISRGETKALKFTNTPKAYKLADLPKALLKVIEESEEKAGTTYDNIPQFGFKNELKMYGCHFYNDFSEDAKFYNTKAYDYVQSLKAEPNNKVSSDDLIGEDEISF
jgi:hypothetical protein